MKGPAAILIAVHSKKCCFVAVKKGERKEKSDCIFKNFKKTQFGCTQLLVISLESFFSLKFKCEKLEVKLQSVNY